MTAYPRDAAARQARRDHEYHQYMCQAEPKAMRIGLSIKCGEYGFHAPDGCQNDGTGCLCECHDVKEQA